MLDYTLVLFERVVEVLKVAIPLFIVFDLVGDMLWSRR